jgi:hypothetical protein
VIDAVCRAESRCVLARLIRPFGGFELAEEALREAFAATRLAGRLLLLRTGSPWLLNDTGDTAALVIMTLPNEATVISSMRCPYSNGRPYRSRCATSGSGFLCFLPRPTARAG